MLLITEGVIAATRAALESAGTRRVRHEGVVYWAGRSVADDQLAIAAIVPHAQTSARNFQVSAEANAHAIAWMCDHGARARGPGPQPPRRARRALQIGRRPCGVPVRGACGRSWCLITGDAGLSRLSTAASTVSRAGSFACWTLRRRPHRFTSSRRSSASHEPDDGASSTPSATTGPTRASVFRPISAYAAA